MNLTTYRYFRETFLAAGKFMDFEITQDEIPTPRYEYDIDRMNDSRLVMMYSKKFYRAKILKNYLVHKQQYANNVEVDVFNKFGDSYGDHYYVESTYR